MKALVSGAEIHNFEEAPIYTGKYTGSKQVREKDGKGENQKAGSIVGFVFEDKKGEQTIIGNSYSVEKAIGQINEGDYLRIEFLGQGEKSDGQKFNRFKIDQLEQADIDAL